MGRLSLWQPNFWQCPSILLRQVLFWHFIVNVDGRVNIYSHLDLPCFSSLNPPLISSSRVLNLSQQNFSLDSLTCACLRWGRLQRCHSPGACYPCQGERVEKASYCKARKERSWCTHCLQTVWAVHRCEDQPNGFGEQTWVSIRILHKLDSILGGIWPAGTHCWGPEAGRHAAFAPYFLGPFSKTASWTHHCHSKWSWVPAWHVLVSPLTRGWGQRIEEEAVDGFKHTWSDWQRVFPCECQHARFGRSIRTSPLEHARAHPVESFLAFSSSNQLVQRHPGELVPRSGPAGKRAC